MALEKHKSFLKTLKFFCEEICVSLCIYDSEVVAFLAHTLVSLQGLKKPGEILQHLLARSTWQ